MPRKPRAKKSSTPPQQRNKPSVKRSGVHAPMVMETGNGREDGEIWLARINRTWAQREKRRNGSKDWERYYLWYENEMWHQRGQEFHDLASDNARDTATVPKTTSIAHSYISFLINNRIRFKCKPRRQQDVKSAKIQTAVLNYEFRERGMQEKCIRFVEDDVVIGHGVAKTSYHVEVDEDKLGQREIEYRDFVKVDAAGLERVDPLYFLFDLHGRDGTLKTARWTAEGFFVPYNDVMANTKYDQEVLDLIYAGTYQLNPRSGFEGIMQDEPERRSKLGQDVPENHLVLLWEVLDKGYRKRYIFAEGIPWPLFEEEWPWPYLDGFPYVKIDYIHSPGYPAYGIGIYFLVEDDQMQLNRIRTCEHQTLRANGRKWTASGEVHKDEIKKLTDGPPGSVVRAEQGQIAPLPDAPMSVDFDRIERKMQASMEETSGADAITQGRQLPSRTTAGEVAARVNATALKSEARVGEVERGIEEIGRQLLQHIKANKTVGDVIEITGEAGAESEWMDWTPEDLQAEVDIEVEYFAAPRYDPALDRQQRLTVMDLCTRALPVLQQQGQDVINFPVLLGWVLDSFDDSPEISTFFKPPPPLPPGAPGATTTPQLAGALAPGQVPQGAEVSQPGEGLSEPDMMQQLLGGLSGSLAIQ